MSRSSGRLSGRRSMPEPMARPSTPRRPSSPAPPSDTMLSSRARRTVIKSRKGLEAEQGGEYKNPARDAMARSSPVAVFGRDMSSPGPSTKSESSEPPTPTIRRRTRSSFQLGKEEESADDVESSEAEAEGSRAVSKPAVKTADSGEETDSSEEAESGEEGDEVMEEDGPDPSEPASPGPLPRRSGRLNIVPDSDVSEDESEMEQMEEAESSLSSAESSGLDSDSDEEMTPDKEEAPQEAEVEPSKAVTPPPRPTPRRTTRNSVANAEASTSARAISPTPIPTTEPPKAAAAVPAPSALPAVQMPRRSARQSLPGLKVSSTPVTSTDSELSRTSKPSPAPKPVRALKLSPTIELAPAPQSWSQPVAGRKTRLQAAQQSQVAAPVASGSSEAPTAPREASPAPNRRSRRRAASTPPPMMSLLGKRTREASSDLSDVPDSPVKPSRRAPAGTLAKIIAEQEARAASGLRRGSGSGSGSGAASVSALAIASGSGRGVASTSSSSKPATGTPTKSTSASTRPAWQRKVFLTSGLYSNDYKSHAKVPKGRHSMPASLAVGRSPSGRTSGTARTRDRDKQSAFPEPIHYGQTLLTSDRDFRLPFPLLQEEEAVRAKLETKRKPPPYKTISQNRYVSRPKFSSEIPVCQCAPGGICGEDCLNRILQYVCDPKHCPCGDKCTNVSLRKRPHKKTDVGWYGPRGWGLKAGEAIKRDSFIDEYRGEVIDLNEVSRRVANIYKDTGNFYFLDYDAAAGEVLDGGLCGNITRFANHSCEPNCYIEKWLVRGNDEDLNAEFEIGLYALRDIQAGEELTYDYGWSAFAPKGVPATTTTGGGIGGLAGGISANPTTSTVVAKPIKCLCGASNCCGYLGGKKGDGKKLAALAVATKPRDAKASGSSSKAQKAGKGAKGKARARSKLPKTHPPPKRSTAPSLVGIPSGAAAAKSTAPRPVAKPAAKAAPPAKAAAPPPSPVKAAPPAKAATTPKKTTKAAPKAQQQTPKAGPSRQGLRRGEPAKPIDLTTESDTDADEVASTISSSLSSAPSPFKSNSATGSSSRTDTTPPTSVSSLRKPANEANDNQTPQASAAAAEGVRRSARASRPSTLIDVPRALVESGFPGRERSASASSHDTEMGESSVGKSPSRRQSSAAKSVEPMPSEALESFKSWETTKPKPKKPSPNSKYPPEPPYNPPKKRGRKLSGRRKVSKAAMAGVDLMKYPPATIFYTIDGKAYDFAKLGRTKGRRPHLYTWEEYNEKLAERRDRNAFLARIRRAKSRTSGREISVDTDDLNSLAGSQYGDSDDDGEGDERGAASGGESEGDAMEVDEETAINQEVGMESEIATPAPEPVAAAATLSAEAPVSVPEATASKATPAKPTAEPQREDDLDDLLDQGDEEALEDLFSRSKSQGRDLISPSPSGSTLTTPRKRSSSEAAPGEGSSNRLIPALPSILTAEGMTKDEARRSRNAFLARVRRNMARGYDKASAIRMASKPLPTDSPDDPLVKAQNIAKEKQEQERKAKLALGARLRRAKKKQEQMQRRREHLHAFIQRAAAADGDIVILDDNQSETVDASPAAAAAASGSAEPTTPAEQMLPVEEEWVDIENETPEQREAREEEEARLGLKPGESRNRSLESLRRLTPNNRDEGLRAPSGPMSPGSFYSSYLYQNPPPTSLSNGVRPVPTKTPPPPKTTPPIPVPAMTAAPIKAAPSTSAPALASAPAVGAASAARPASHSPVAEGRPAKRPRPSLPATLSTASVAAKAPTAASPPANASGPRAPAPYTAGLDMRSRFMAARAAALNKGVGGSSNGTPSKSRQAA